jgi:tryptophanyl-tRNA synthetase
MKEELTNRDLSTFGFLGYPCFRRRTSHVQGPWRARGGGSLPHVELTREITRRFNFLYREIFPIPEPLLTNVPKLLGIDGRKMSKSYDNSIFISDRGDALNGRSWRCSPITAHAKTDPGRPELCNVFSFHGLYSEEAAVGEIEVECRRAGIGCIECKKCLAARIAGELKTVHERQDYYRSHMDEVRGIIDDGNARALKIARATMEEVREAVKI